MLDGGHRTEPLRHTTKGDRRCHEQKSFWTNRLDTSSESSTRLPRNLTNHNGHEGTTVSRARSCSLCRLWFCPRSSHESISRASCRSVDRRSRYNTVPAANEQLCPEEANQQERHQIHGEHESRRTQVVGGIDVRVHGRRTRGSRDRHVNGKRTFMIHDQRGKLPADVAVDRLGRPAARVVFAI